MPRPNVRHARPALLALIAAAAALSAPAGAEQLSPEQMAAAQQVYLGDAECEFKQSVHLKAVDGRPGHFELRFKKARYMLTPEPTATGAIRLEDRQAGIVWLQIPAKSMLLNARLGRREVDGCLHAEQRAETGASTPSIGIAQR
jgi:hypothetical protein